MRTTPLLLALLCAGLMQAHPALAKEVPSTSISVDTYEGRVQSSGTLDSKDRVAAAGKVAAAVAGVRSVKNDLRTK